MGKRTRIWSCPLSRSSLTSTERVKFTLDDNNPIDVLNYVLSEEFSRVPSLTFHLIIAGIQRVDPDETKKSSLKLSRLAAFTFSEIEGLTFLIPESDCRLESMN